MALTAGARLGPYEIVSALGAGGMGEVYKARDTRLQRTVALKVLSSELAVDQAFRARFEREARAIAALSHPHICAIYDVGQDQGVEYLVMEYLEGETLADRVARARGPLALDLALKVGSEIADALEKAHRAGIIHRDLKPANIILTKSGAKLLDFGLAKLRGPAVPISMSAIEGATTTSPATAHGTILGTIHYMAPEQVEGREADARSDIWALGAVLYEMTTGQRPFDGTSAASVIGAILKDTVPPISARQPIAPAALDHLVARCLDKDPDERWQNAGDVKRELTWIARAPQTSANASAASSRGSRSLLPWLAAVAVTVVMGAGAARFWWAPPEPSPAARSTLAIVPPDGIRIVGAGALSHDGHSFVFVGQGSSGPPVLWIRSIDTGQARVLADTDDPAYPFWSPASDSIGFFAAGRLKTISAGGGPSKVLATAPNGRGGSWGPDGTILFVPDTNSSIMRIPEKGGDASAVTRLDSAGGQIGHRWPRHIDAQHFVYTVQAARPEATGIYLATLGSQSTARLVPQFSNTEYSADSSCSSLTA